MLRKRSTRIIFFLIAAELILLGAIVLVQQRMILGLIRSANVALSSNPNGVASQTPLPSSLEATEAIADPTPSPITSSSSQAHITLVAPSPGVAPNQVISASPTLPPIMVISPTPQTQRPNAAPLVNPQSSLDGGPSSKSSHVVISAIGVDSPVVEMGYTLRNENGQEIADWQVPDNAVGHMINSANPGTLGNVVLSGHNNIYGAVFKKLYTLKTGDELTLYNKGGSGFLYRVVQSYIVQEQGADLNQRLANARVLLPTGDARVTLISCWPETDNSDRAIVIGELVGRVQ
jgi:LPXTG-site transpeptidase (sortase) family protein